eukprot:GFKZ01014205.1.p1 GENE.GFKZ01014205.1~~GFKZ01014205.1.p1  ORF type:complete len:241 (-),score=25.15 GFKZ01014205.1:103-825(-)
MAPPAHRPLTPILLLTLLHSVSSSPSSPPFIFPPSKAHCTSGSAQSQPYLYPPSDIHCTMHTPPSTTLQCDVPSHPLYKFFFRISDATIHCSPSTTTTDCTLDYTLDFTLPAVFALGFTATALCGVLLAAAMYMAVGRVMHGYYESLKRIQREQEKEEEEIKALYSMIPPLPRGYGSFGRRLDVIGGWDGSFSSLVGMEEAHTEGVHDGGEADDSPSGGQKARVAGGKGWDGWQDELYFG